ncbi:MAG: hypothetical protein Q9Q40_07645 [Acidobacteriota bacterium]|nr:hypothetical protein [Acidobacteriota bacterium]MDQ7088349.1 hypothetical protein [Acidobacteriota bacterium]
MRPWLPIVGLLAAAALAAACTSRLSAASRPAAADTPPAAETWPIEARVSYLVNLFHWVDNLAGTSIGKTRAVYQRQWEKTFGPPSPADAAQLEAYRQVRTRPEPVVRPDRLPDAQSCLPTSFPRLSARQRFNTAVLRSDTLPQLERALAPVVGPADAATVRRVLAHFEPRFRRLWPRMAFLGPFHERFERWLRARPVQDLMLRFAHFLEVQADPSRPTVVHLVGLLEQGSTHAEASGRFLLVEIRPADGPADQTQVIFHELAHDLLRRQPARVRDAFARRLMARGAVGALAQTLLHEGLPTALGQGVARATLTPNHFAFRDRWYHVDAIDRFAHRIYTAVRQEIHSPRSYSSRLPDLVGDAVAGSPTTGSTPIAFFVSHAAFLARGNRLDVLRPLMRSAAGRAQFGVATDHPDGRTFLARHPCQPLIWLLTAEEMTTARLPDGDLIPAAHFAVPPSARSAGWIVPATRKSGAAVLLLIGRDASALPLLVERTARLRGWPQRTIAVSPR